jgi:transposase
MVLYLAALQASRRSAVFCTLRKRPSSAGKFTRAARIATARNLLVKLNTMLATTTDHNPAAT